MLDPNGMNPQNHDRNVQSSAAHLSRRSDLSGYLIGLGRAALARREEGNLPEARKLGWRAVNQFGLRNAEDFLPLDALDLVQGLEPKVRGPFCTLLCLVGDSCWDRGFQREAAHIYYLAGMSYSADRYAVNTLTEIALGKKLNNREHHIISRSVGTLSEQLELLNKSLRVLEKHLLYSFAIDVTAAAPQPLPSSNKAQMCELLRVLRMSNSVMLKGLSAFGGKDVPHLEKDLIALLQRGLAFHGSFLISLKLPLDPVQLLQLEQLQIPVAEEAFPYCMRYLSEAFSKLAAAYERVGSPEQGAASLELSKAFQLTY